MAIERKAEKRSVYADSRDLGEEGDTMETWDQDKLNEVIDKKHATEKTMPTTTIVIILKISGIIKS